AELSKIGGSDWAYGGATTGPGTSHHKVVHNVGQQVDDYFTGAANHASSDALYAIWAGGNDLVNEADRLDSAALTRDSVGEHDMDGVARQAAANLFVEIKRLI